MDALDMDMDMDMDMDITLVFSTFPEQAVYLLCSLYLQDWLLDRVWM
jgi:hypothetical protein